MVNAILKAIGMDDGQNIDSLNVDIIQLSLENREC